MYRVAITLAVAGCAAGAPDGSAPGRSRVVVFRGMCDASGAVPLSPDRFIVADDETNRLRVYDAERGGWPIAEYDISSVLRPEERAARRDPPEIDLEAATRVGDQAYWLTSHGRDQRGNRRPERLRLFATSVTTGGEQVEVVGRAYDRLLDDLIAAPHLHAFDLAAAAARPPRAEGGLNIEGLTAVSAGSVVIGFRNPLHRGRAIIVPLHNPAQLVADPDARADLGQPILVDLAGQGIRALSTWHGWTLIIAGNSGDGPASRLYTWSGAGEPSPVDLDLSWLNPEAFFTPEERDAILIVSDDGTERIDGVECKRLTDSTRRRFRALWFEPSG